MLVYCGAGLSERMKGGEQGPRKGGRAGWRWWLGQAGPAGCGLCPSPAFLMTPALETPAVSRPALSATLRSARGSQRSVGMPVGTRDLSTAVCRGSALSVKGQRGRGGATVAAAAAAVG